jgi:hypothetical protein
MFRLFVVSIAFVAFNFVARAQSDKYVLSDVLRSAKSASIKSNNIVCNDSLKLVSLPVKPGTNLKVLDPAFISTSPDIKIYPTGKTDFSKGAVEYTITAPGQIVKYKVEARVAGNPFWMVTMPIRIFYTHSIKRNFIYTRPAMVLTDGRAPISKYFHQTTSRNGKMKALYSI